ncbi:SDR family NAD(P)-dependent oxidoreductase [Oceanithermus desulfurans]|uniref:Short-chain dehydrogenase n=2 Tax=Oceanithermus desulfurans TaxID=227924 RepID=A0A511RHS1_9DEIN|nr:SDR family NAD(P)-dependent oxidoreductase [Oceanithermus desulfurans]MBB6029179.1 NAD(P)-dependent dehydrogenase (short-subunit alcohol dehydrogenase family) [Oceanithermus desulfurans]GEM89183.1 short-chain dehydrogenase [Oceanithermus desulfurans NBRC 100063]
METKVALVTGSNRGIGFEVVRKLARRGYRVALAARRRAAAEEAASKLTAEGLDVWPLELDVSDDASVQEARRLAEEHLGRLDALVNNAGVLLDEDRRLPGLELPVAAVRATFEVNTFGPLRVTQAFAPLLLRQGGNVVNVSSVMGQLASAGPGYLAYRSSKAALNMVTRVLAAELAPHGVRVNAVHPGWIRTRMGGPEAPGRPEEGAEPIVALATLGPDGPSGGFFGPDLERLEW